jgi:DNA helicase-2/ATP-dependent DNA helicase PcrA
MADPFAFPARAHERDPLAGLNPPSTRPCCTSRGPALVLAGAGSGKTRVLTTRVARLVQHHGVDPARSSR